MASIPNTEKEKNQGAADAGAPQIIITPEMAEAAAKHLYETMEHLDPDATGMIEWADLSERMQPGPGERAMPQQPMQQRPTAGQQMSPDGMDPGQIRHIQQALNDKGMKVGVDGVWGRQSDRALRNFQRQHGMRATGRLDPQTMTALGASMPGEGRTPRPPSVSPGAPPSGQQPQEPQQPPQQDQQRAPEPPTAPGTRPQ